MFVLHSMLDVRCSMFDVRLFDVQYSMFVLRKNLA